MRSVVQPSITEEGISFTVVVDAVKRECLITPQALHELSALKSESTDANIMEVFHAFEAKINGVARRLVAAGVAGSPLVIRPETFSSPRSR